MRILHAIHSVNPKGGGPIEGIRQLAARNIAEGHVVEIVTLDAPGEPWIEGFPVRVHAVGPSYFGYGYTPRLVPWLKAHHRDYDVVVVNGLWQYSSFGVWRALRNTPTPYCVFTHGMLDPWFKRQYPLKHLKKWLYWPWGEYRVLRDALAVFFTTEEERRLARRSFWLYHCDEIVIPYGISGPVGEPTLQREAFLKQFPQLQGKRLMLFLSRIHPKKGCDLLLNAFAKLVTRGESPANANGALHLVMAGPADSEHGLQLKAMAQKLGLGDRITWTGMLAGDLKWGAFHAAEVFVLPSHQENFGIAVAEALACGLPVLISNKVNIWREVRMHGAGVVEGDDQVSVDHLLQFWESADEAQRQAMRDNARVCFQKCFNVDRFAQVFVESLKLLGMDAERKAR